MVTKIPKELKMKCLKESLFHSYRIRVAEVVRDYTGTDRNEAPADSRDALA